MQGQDEHNALWDTELVAVWSVIMYISVMTTLRGIGMVMYMTVLMYLVLVE